MKLTPELILVCGKKTCKPRNKKEKHKTKRDMNFISILGFANEDSHQ
jgi:hypothetical protein